MAFNAYPNIKRGEPFSLDGIKADDGNVYSPGRDGKLYRRRFGVIAVWGVWEEAWRAEEIAAFERAVGREIDHLLSNLTWIGQDAADDLQTMVYG